MLGLENLDRLLLVAVAYLFGVGLLDLASERLHLRLEIRFLLIEPGQLCVQPRDVIMQFCNLGFLLIDLLLLLFELRPVTAASARNGSCSPAIAARSSGCRATSRGGIASWVLHRPG